MTLAKIQMLTDAAALFGDWLSPLLAQVAAASDKGEGAGTLLEFFASPLNLILISAILFMFLVARPQQKQRKEQDKAQAELKKNDRVVTHSGIHGIVVQTQDGLVTMRIDENTGARMTVNRDTIASITPSDSKE